MKQTADLSLSSFDFSRCVLLFQSIGIQRSRHVIRALHTACTRVSTTQSASSFVCSPCGSPKLSTSETTALAISGNSSTILDGLTLEMLSFDHITYSFETVLRIISFTVRANCFTECTVRCEAPVVSNCEHSSSVCFFTIRFMLFSCMFWNSQSSDDGTLSLSLKEVQCQHPL